MHERRDDWGRGNRLNSPALNIRIFASVQPMATNVWLASKRSRGLQEHGRWLTANAYSRSARILMELS